jgi:hypothetical protein
LWRKVSAVVIAAALPIAESGPLAAETVGRTALVVQQVTGTMGSNVRRLIVRDDVNRDELVATATESASEIVFLDGTSVSLGPNAQLVLDEYVYDARPSQAKMVVRFVEGAFRFVTGGFSSNAYTIVTPTATIGVRGTNFRCAARRLNGGSSSDMATLCQVTEGAILFTNLLTGETSRVGAGQTILAAPGSGSSVPGTDGATELTLLAALDELNILPQTSLASLAGLGVVRPLPGTTPVFTSGSGAADTMSGAASSGGGDGGGTPPPTVVLQTVAAAPASPSGGP